jgi:tetratricopeptide (TPR) repeat protein/tRNA A-37 threonylcarbamoyl transferase component Bud32
MARRIDVVRDQFEAAIKDGQHPRIEDYLSRLDEEDDRRVALEELLLLEFEYRRERGDAPRVEEYEARFPQVVEFVASTIRRRLREETVSQPINDTPSVRRAQLPVVDDSGTIVGDYELIEKVGEGGMGVVYKARQRRLNRVVALKMMRGGPSATAEDVKRFRGEAMAAANLRHPGIVTIHEVGEHNGIHFISMEFVEGQSLSERLRESAIPPQRAAMLVEAVAEAVQFAHGRGVLHRDLKPSNILLDPNDRPRVVDFGLAKRVESDSELTRTGQILGTPSYMPPEQAGGKPETVDARGDVYSLGALLYELLTGRPPFRGATAWETIRQVVETEPVSPRVLDATIPKDLETISLKCLDKRPEGRYTTAGALAEDLQRFQRGEPITARPIGHLLCAARWCQRKPLVAGLSAAVVLALVTGTAVSTWFGIEAHHRATEASQSATMFRAERDRADDERDRTQQALAETRRAIDKYVETVRNAELLKDERFRPLLNALLEDALQHYQCYIDAYEHGPDDRADLAHALNIVGSLSHTSGDIERARRSYTQAIEVLSLLARSDPTAVRVREELAEAYKGLVAVRYETGELAGAEATLEKVSGLYDPLIAEHPTIPKYRHELAKQYRMLGNVKHRGGKPLEAANCYRKAIAIEESLIAGGDDDAHRFELALNTNLLGNVQKDTGESPAAMTSYRKAIEMFTSLLAKTPSSTAYRSGLAATYGSLAGAQARHGSGSDAVTSYGKAIELRRRLVEDHPNVREYRDELAAGYLNLGTVQQRIGKLDEAAESYEAVTKIAGQLASENPTVGRNREQLASGYTNLGILQNDTGRLDAAVDSHGKAIQLFKKLAAESPSVAGHRAHLARSYTNLGSVQVKRRDTAAGAASFKKSIEILERLVADHPLDDYFEVLAKAYINLGIARREAGEFAESAERYRKAIEIYDRLAGKNPTATEFRMGAAAARFHLAIDQKRAGKLPQAATSLAQAIQLYARLAAQDPAVGEYRGWLAGSHAQLGDVQARMGETSQAVMSLDSAIETFQKLAADITADNRFRDMLVDACMDLARLQRRSGNLKSAIAAASKAIETGEQRPAVGTPSPRSAPTLSMNRAWRGDVHVLLGQLDEAKTDYRRAIEAAGDTIENARLLDWHGRLAALSNSCKWQVKYYPWQESDDLTRPEVWTEVLNNKPLVIADAAAMHFPRQSAPPVEGVPADYFALVAQTEMEFDGGEYDAAFWADDGARLFVDGKLVLDGWKMRKTSTRSAAKLRPTAGKHTLEVEFFKATGDARLTLAITPRR